YYHIQNSKADKIIQILGHAN
ncbi:transcriptional regulator, partial [Bacillus mycoides]